MTVRLPYDGREPKWVKTFHIKSSATLTDLMEFTLNSIDFDFDHSYDFFLRRYHTGYDGEVSENLKLYEVYPSDKKKLFLLYDYGDNWLFEFRKSRKKVVADKEIKYPKIVNTIGEDPIQYPTYDDE
jgi:hypothetical protein